jgi:hypothetical protein
MAGRLEELKRSALARRQPLSGTSEQAEEEALRALYFAFFRFAAQ